MRNHFNPQASDNCFCNSGKKFAACCGSTAAERPPPAGVFVVHNAMSDEKCDSLVNYAQSRPKTKLSVVTRKADGNLQVEEDSSRITKKVDLGRHQVKMDKLYEKILAKYVEPAIGRGVEWYEPPDIMFYTKGGRYDLHCDNGNGNPKKGFIRAIDRDISILLYLNDDYKGGSLSFPMYNYNFQPRKGDLLFFPSDHRYLHQANEVTDGSRYVMVSWVAILGGKRVPAKPLDLVMFKGARQEL